MPKIEERPCLEFLELWGTFLLKMSDGGRSPVNIGPSSQPKPLVWQDFLKTLSVARKKTPSGHSTIKPGAQLRWPSVYEEASHLEVIFSSLSRNHIVRMLPTLLTWVCASWNRLISWGSIQEMFILYFKLSF